MTPRARIIVGAVGLVLVAVLLRSVAVSLYFEPRRQLVESIDTAQGRVEGYRRSLEDAKRVRREIDAYAARTLGRTEESVHAQLRERLNRIAEAVQLRDTNVGTGKPSARRSPARTAFPRSSTWKDLRDQVDFVELDGTISGEGTLEQAIALIDRIDAEPWLKRIDFIGLDPRDNGERVGVTVRLTTLFLPDFEPEPIEPMAYDEARLARFTALIAANPFKLPPSPAVAAEPTAAPPALVDAPPPGFPWAEWQVTGVALGLDGGEVWLRNRASGETHRLGVGGTLDVAVLEAVDGEWAVFHIEATRFRVRIGTTMSDRSPVSE